MFSTKEYLAKKTGPYGVGRLSYLQQLINEFQDTESKDAKHQVLANLANFAYDPINYDFLWQLNIIDLFLDCLVEDDGQLVEYAISGICNVALDAMILQPDKQLYLLDAMILHTLLTSKQLIDERSRDHLVKSKSVPLIVKCLSSSNEETVITAITCLIFLITPQTHADIVELPVVEAMLRLSHSSNSRLSNLAYIFLQDHCTTEHIREAEAVGRLWDQQDEQASLLIQQHAGLIASGSSAPALTVRL